MQPEPPELVGRDERTAQFANQPERRRRKTLGRAQSRYLGIDVVADELGPFECEEPGADLFETPRRRDVVDRAQRRAAGFASTREHGEGDVTERPDVEIVRRGGFAAQPRAQASDAGIGGRCEPDDARPVRGCEPQRAPRECERLARCSGSHDR
ncbi:MAG: hypothetical protein NVS3B16_09030 [Vulcanimicrobiaceae bacterium]